MKTAKILSLILGCVFAATGAIAEDSITEIHLASESWEDTTNADGTGLYWEIFRAVYEPLGITLTFEIVPYARAVNMVEHKEVDASVGAYIDEFEALFPQWHFDRDLVLAVFKKGRLEQWEGEQSLSGKLGWMRGYEYDQYLEQAHEFVEVDTRKSAYKMLEFGHIDFFLDAEPEVETEFAREDLDADAFQTEILLKLNLYLAFADTERGRKLLTLFDTQIGKLVASGELKPLFETWGYSYPFDE